MQPIPEVVIDKVRLVPFQPNTAYVGRLQAEDDVRIQANVSGYLKGRHFTEGQMVVKGSLLYEIDPAQFEAVLARVKAEMAKAKVAQQVAKKNLKRGQKLALNDSISASDLDQLTGTKLQADAEWEASKAQLKSAEVDLSYTRIIAPISGNIGRSDFSTGDRIGPDSGALTTLVSIDPVKAVFQVSESVYLIGIERLRAAREKLKELPKWNVKLELSNRQIYPLVGHVDYIANRIDEATGTIEARASIPNPQGELKPGQYVKVVLELPFEINTLMLPQAAVQADQQGSFVLTVGPDNKIQRRNVVLDTRVGELVVVKLGVDEGDSVVVRGLQQVRPGQVVRVNPLPAPPPTQIAEPPPKSTLQPPAATEDNSAQPIPADTGEG
jgi:membrane fusion protein, multidrug efflux system